MLYMTSNSRNMIWNTSETDFFKYWPYLNKYYTVKCTGATNRAFSQPFTASAAPELFIREPTLNQLLAALALFS